MTPEQKIIKDLSDRIVAAQAPIRILDAIKWDDGVKQAFLASQCKRLPPVDEEYYKKRPLPFDPVTKQDEFISIIRDAKKLLGEYSSITRLIEGRCNEYCKVIQMLMVRGTPQFSAISKELFGGPQDVFYPAGPKLSELGNLLADVLKNLLSEVVQGPEDEKRYTAREAMVILQERLSNYFSYTHKVVVQLSDSIVADAAAGADCIKLNSSVKFSDRDLRYLEVHEGWVHVGTTLNGAEQPYCTFLAKGSPSSSVTQEGLAVVTEVFTFSSYPLRMLKLTNRVKAIGLVDDGADFLEAFQFFREQGRDEEESYNYCMRVFRGSAPTLGPFTKDLSYTKGFLLIYNYIRIAVQKSQIHKIPLFFVGKTLIQEISIIDELVDQGLIVPPLYLPPQFKDLAALSAWMCFSLFLNKFNLEEVAKYYRMF